LRKYAPSANYRNPGIWTVLNNMIPTDRGTYRTPMTFTVRSTTNPATPGTTLAAWCGLTFTGVGVGYVGTTTKLYTFTVGGVFTDKSKGGGYTNTATGWSFCQYGNITLAANAVDATQFRDATGATAFADLAAAPIAKILLTQSNCVLAFNLSTGGADWKASDVGDYTNWTTLEAVGGTIYQRPGPITAAVAFKDDVIVFKANSVYRMTYVGDKVKWTTSLLADGIGCDGHQDAIVCGDRVIFTGSMGAYSFDGANFQDLMQGWNNSKSMGGCSESVYWPKTNTVWFAFRGVVYPFNISSGNWGSFGYVRNTTGSGGDTTHATVRGEPAARIAVLGTIYEFATSDAVTLIDLSSTSQSILSGNAAWSTAGALATIQTHLYGTDTGTTAFTRLTPILSVEGGPNGGGSLTPADTGMTLTVIPYDGPDGSGQGSTSTITSSTARNRFDFTVTARYAQFAINCTNSYFEIEDVIVDAKPAGLD
jgi:hypothetical protein